VPDAVPADRTTLTGGGSSHRDRDRHDRPSAPTVGPARCQTEAG
jgi:hypothetical protein